MYYIYTVYLRHLRHEIKQRKMNLHLCIFYLKVTPHTHPPCTSFNQVLHMWYMVLCLIYAHPCKTVHSLTSQKII